MCLLGSFYVNLTYNNYFYMKQTDTRQSKFQSLRTFMKTKADPNQENSFRNNQFHNKLIKNQAEKSMRSTVRLKKSQYSCKKSTQKAKCFNQSISAQKVDHFRSISLIINQQNVNLNQQKKFLLNQIKLLQDKDKNRKMEIKQLKQKFKVLQTDYLQLQKLNLSIKFKFQALIQLFQDSYKKDSNFIQIQDKQSKNHSSVLSQAIDQQQANYKNNIAFSVTQNSKENSSYMKYFPASTIRSIPISSIQKKQSQYFTKQHFPISLEEINKDITINELFIILESNFERLVIQYKQKMDQRIRKQYKQIAKCIGCVKTYLKEFSKQKYNQKNRSKQSKNCFQGQNNNQNKKQCSQISEQSSTSCFCSIQEDNFNCKKQKQILQNQNMQNFFEKYIP